MVDAFYLLYVSWLESDLISSCKDEIQIIHNKYILTEGGISKIKEIKTKIKSLTEDGERPKTMNCAKNYIIHLISNSYLLFFLFLNPWF